MYKHLLVRLDDTPLALAQADQAAIQALRKLQVLIDAERRGCLLNSSQRALSIERKTDEAVGISRFELVVPDGQVLPPFSAGSHIDAHLPDGLVRQYSLATDPRDKHRDAVLRDANSRGGSIGMYALELGATIAISDPKKHFALAHIGQLPTFSPHRANPPGGAADLKRWLPLPLCKHWRTPCAH